MTNKYPQAKKCPYCKRLLSFAYGSYTCYGPGCPGMRLRDEQLKADKSEYSKAKMRRRHR